MKLKWNAEFERRYYFNAEGINARLHFQKGTIINVPEKFVNLYLMKLSDPINAGYIEVIE